MSNPFVAEIRMFAGNFAPTGWATCDGQIMSISQNTALFSLLGTTYGGNGTSNFALPNLQDSAPIHQGQGPGLSNYILGQTGGEQNVTLLTSQMPSHAHALNCSNTNGNQPSPSGNLWAKAHLSKASENIYAATSDSTHMNAGAIGASGGGQPHNNMPPYLCLTFIIALQGVYPPRS